MSFVEPIRDIDQIHELQSYIKNNYSEKYYVLLMLGLYSGLRVGDILRLKIKDIRENGQIVDKVRIVASKNHKAHYFPINPELKKILKAYCKGKEDNQALIYSTKLHPEKALDRRQAWKVIHRASEEIGLKKIGTHSMRKTFGYTYYQKTKDIATLQKILGHSEPSITMHYIGIEEDDILGAFKYIKY